MRRKWKNRVMSGVLSAAMVLSMTPGAVFGAAQDTAAQEVFSEEAAEGKDMMDILSGADGKIEFPEFLEEQVQPDIDLSGGGREDSDDTFQTSLIPRMEDSGGEEAAAAAIASVPAALDLAGDDISRPEGGGTQEDPYRITSPEELRWFAGLVNGALAGVEQNTAACAILQNDISFAADMDAGKSWTPIGSGKDAEGHVIAYAGTFDGNSCEIQSLYLATEDKLARMGLFGRNDGVVKNLTVSDAVVECGDITKDNPEDVQAARGAGVIAGWNAGEIADCRVAISEVRAPYYGGAVAGVNYGSISGASVLLASVTGIECTGGVVGFNGGELSNIASCAYVECEYAAGGIAGVNYGTASDCTFIGTVEASASELDDEEQPDTGSYSGGIAGSNYGVITDCEAGTELSEVPGLDQDPEVAELAEDLLKHSYVSGVSRVGGIVGGSCGTISDCRNHINIYGVPMDPARIPEGQEGAYSYTTRKIGGIVGWTLVDTDNLEGVTKAGAVTGCKNYGMVAGMPAMPVTSPSDMLYGEEVGGIAGMVQGSTLEDCVNYEDVTGNIQVGGIAGYVLDDYMMEEDQEITYASVIRGCSNEEQPLITAKENVGGIAGISDDSLIENCKNTGTVSAAGSDSAGGIVGWNAGHIADCVNGDPDAQPGSDSSSRLLGAVTATEMAGGIAGANAYQGVIEGCANYAAVIVSSDAYDVFEDGDILAGDGYYAGGITGVNSASVRDCTVAGENAAAAALFGAGGVAGANFGTVENCTAEARLVGTMGVGGIAGFNSDAPAQYGLEELEDPDYAIYIPDTWPALIKGCGYKGNIRISMQTDRDGNPKAAVCNAFGGITGRNEGQIADCEADVMISDDNAAEDNVSVMGVGGITGTNVAGQIADAYSIVDIQTETGASVGGIAGGNNGTIRGCQASGQMKASYFMGGIAGLNMPEGVIDESQLLRGRLELAERPADAADEDFDGGFLGGIAGVNMGVVTSCDSRSGSMKCLYSAGGVAGYNGGVIKDSRNSVEILASQIAGGIAGENDTSADLFEGVRASDAANRGVITGCVNAAAVIGQERDVWSMEALGGIVGVNSGSIKDCINDGLVDGGARDSWHIGGIAGESTWSSEGDPGVISGCENHGDVKGVTGVGGVAGMLYGGTVDKSFNDGGVQLTMYGGGVAGIVSGTDAHPASITSCYNQGQIDSMRGYIGGIAGVTDPDSAEAGSSVVEIANCYNTGAVVSNPHMTDADQTGGISGGVLDGAGDGAVQVSNCFYLEGCVNGTGVCGEEDSLSGAYAAAAEDFANGHIAWSLQTWGSYDTLVWGQKLPQIYETSDRYPVLAQVEEEKVVHVFWLTEQEVLHEDFTNAGAALEDHSDARDGYWLDGWYTDQEMTAKWDFETDTMDDQDMILFARWVPYQYGDADLSGDVGVKDALTILRSVVGATQLDAQQQIQADVDGDGEILVKDALLVLKKVVGAIDRFPVEGDEPASDEKQELAFQQWKGGRISSSLLCGGPNGK